MHYLDLIAIILGYAVIGAALAVAAWVASAVIVHSFYTFKHLSVMYRHREEVFKTVPKGFRAYCRLWCQVFKYEPEFHLDGEADLNWPGKVENRTTWPG